MKIPKKSYLPLFSEEEYQKLLSEVKNGNIDSRKKIISNLNSIIYDILKEFKDCKYEYNVLYLFGLRGASNAIEYYDKDKSNMFIPWARQCIYSSIYYQVKNHPIPAVPSYFNGAIDNIMLSFNITNNDLITLLKAHIKFYLENIKSDTYRNIILKYYTDGYTISKVAKEYYLKEEQVENIINVFNEMVKSKINLYGNKYTNEVKDNLNKHSFYERVKDYVFDASEMYEIFNSLNDYYKKVLTSCYGANLDEIHNEEIYKYTSELNRIITNKFKNRYLSIKAKPFYERVKDYVLSIEEMHAIFNTLPEEYKNVLILCYGNNLDEVHEKNISNNSSTINNIIYRKFKNRTISASPRQRIKPFFDRVSPYVSSKEEMYDIFNNLPDKYKNVLTLCYGENLNKMHEEEILKNQGIISTIIYNKFKNKKKTKLPNPKTFYERVSPYVSSTSEMYDILSSLSDDYKNILTLCYGNNLDEVHPEEITLYNDTICNIISDKFKNRVVNEKLFYERVKDYVSNKEEMEAMYKSLPEPSINILKESFGDNLDEINLDKALKYQKQITDIINKYYKNKTNNLRFKSFYERVSIYVTKEEMYNIFASLSDKYKSILILCYGAKLDEIHESELKENRCAIANIIKRNFKDKKVNKKLKPFYERIKNYVSNTSEMLDIFNSLNDEYKRVLTSCYGENLNEVHPDEILKNSSIIGTIITNKFKNKPGKRKIKSLYERVKDYESNTSEMYDIFSTLSDNYKKVLTMCYGASLDEIHEKEIKEYALTLNNIILHKFKERCQNRKFKTFYEKVSPYVSDKKEMLDIFNALPKYYKDVLVLCYGISLDEVHEDKIRENNQTISNIINNKFKNKHANLKMKPFYDRVSPYVSSKEEMLSIFSILPYYYKDVLILCYGASLDEMHEDKIREYSSTIVSIINNKFRKKIANQMPKTFYERIKKIIDKPDEIYDVFNSLNAYQKEVLISCYGTNLNEVHPDEIRDNRRKVDVIIRCIKNKKENKTKKNIISPSIITSLTKLFYSLVNITSYEDIEELLIFSFRIDETNKYTIEDISILFNKTKEEINEISKRCLIKYSDIFEVLYTGIINVLNENTLNNPVKQIKPLKGGNHE